MNVHLPVDLYSADQLGAVILELRDYVGGLRDAAVRQRAGRPVGEAPHMSSLLLGVMHGANAKPGDTAAAGAVLAELETLRDKATIAHITLAALPNRTIKRQFTVWFRAEVYPYTFLTFAMRSDIGGGVIVQIGSKLYDFSFRQVLLGNRARIAEIFNGV